MKKERKTTAEQHKRKTWRKSNEFLACLLHQQTALHHRTAVEAADDDGRRHSRD